MYSGIVKMDLGDEGGKQDQQGQQDQQGEFFI